VNDPELTTLVAKHHKIAQDWFNHRPQEPEPPIAEENLRVWQKELVDEFKTGKQIIIHDDSSDCVDD